MFGADLGTLAIAVGGIFVAYAVILALLVASGRYALAREAAMLVPNLLRLFRGLLGDPRVPWRGKLVLVLALAWLASPIDLVPEFIPVVGPLDDAIVAALALRYLAAAAGAQVIAEHWHGDEVVLRKLLGLARIR